jgi:surface antigen
MNRWNRVLASIGIVTMLGFGTAGCGGVHAAHANNANQVGGGLIGGVAGGLLGSQIGGGSGKVAAIIGGTLAGVALGSYVGGYMDRADQQYMSRTLEYHPTGQASSWRNPDTGHRYDVTPVRTYQESGGRYCREFTTQVYVGGRLEEAYGTACRMPDGSWQIQDQVAEVARGPRHEPAPVYVVHEPVYRHGPPPWAPAYGHRARYTYYYYPAYQVYFDIHRNLYFYADGRHWKTSRVSPIRAKRVETVVLTMRTDKPYHYHGDVRRHYPHERPKGKGRDRR